MRRAVFALLALVTELTASEIRLEVPEIEVKLASETGYSITSIRDAATGREFISPEAKLPLYRITLSRADGSSSDVTSATASSASLRQTALGATLVFEHATEHLQITCAVRADSAAPRVLW